MRRISAIVYALFIAVNAFAQYSCALGTDLAAVMQTGGVNMTAIGRIGSRWSVSWRSEISIESILGTKDVEYEEHNGEFIQPYHRSEVAHNSSIGVEYWPHGAFQGAYLGTGLTCLEDTGTDCYMSIGYCIQIYKGLYTIMSYGTDILATMRSGKPSGAGLGIRLYLAIGKQS
jgi:hypothetical protein